jgi:hypothetical protein
MHAAVKSMGGGVEVVVPVVFVAPCLSFPLHAQGRYSTSRRVRVLSIQGEKVRYFLQRWKMAVRHGWPPQG